MKIKMGNEEKIVEIQSKFIIDDFSEFVFTRLKYSKHDNVDLKLIPTRKIQRPLSCTITRNRVLIRKQELKSTR